MKRGSLAERAREGLTATGRMLATVLMGSLALIAITLPWLLRVILVFIWGYGVYEACYMLWTEYAYVPHIPRLALMSTMALVAVFAPLYVVEQRREYIWGGLGLTGAVLAALAWIYPAFANRHPVSAAILPITLAVSLHAYIMVRSRRKDG